MPRPSRRGTCRCWIGPCLLSLEPGGCSSSESFCGVILKKLHLSEVRTSGRRYADQHSRFTPQLQGGELCSYCGEVALVVDHVFPFKEFGNNTSFVPACVECNLLVSCKVFDTFEEKRDFVQARLMQKHAKILRCDFTPEELNTLTGRLREYVMQGIKQREILLQRICYVEAPQYLHNARFLGWS